MALMLEISKADGTVTRVPVEKVATQVVAEPGDTVRIVDSATGRTPDDLVLRRAGEDLVVEGTPTGESIQLSGYFADCGTAQPCQLLLEGEAVPKAGAESIASMTDGGTLVYGDAALASAGSAPVLLAQSTSDVKAAADAATAASTGGAEAGAAGGAAASGSSAAAAAAGGAALGGTGSIVLGAVALGGLAAAAGGGGGSDSPAPAPAPTPAPSAPSAPTIATVAGDNIVNSSEKAAGVSVAGTAEAGSTVTVTWGSATQTATADSSGNYTTTFAAADIPADGSTTVSATAANAGGTSAAATATVVVDATGPTTTIATVAGDNTVDSAEKAAGVTVSGTAEAGSSVAVTWGATTHTAIADGSGNYSVSFTTGEVPADGTTTITATATDTNGNAGAAATASIVVDTAGPAAPVIGAVATDNIVDSAEKAAGVTVSGTAEAASTVAVTWGGTTHNTTADGSGNFSVSFATGEIPADGNTTVSATATNGNGTSPAGTAAVVIDTAGPAAPVIGAVATDNVVNSAEKAAGVTVSGTAEANSNVAVTWGGTTHNATADGSGNFSVSFATGEVPADGATTISATATDTNSNTGPAGTANVTVDTAAPAAPVIGAVATDNVVNSTEKTAGVTVSGTAEANSDVAVTWGGTTHNATADGAGNFSVVFATGEVPADGATSTISATATDTAGNAGTAGTHDVLIDKTAPSAPTGAVGTDGSVVGTTEAGATIALDHDGNGGTAALTTVAGSTGNYSFAPGTVTAAAGSSLSIVATDTAGNPGTAGAAVVPDAGTAGNDTLNGTAGVDKIFGLAGIDTITGQAGNDWIDGGTGDDNLDGGANNDVLVGGLGNDTINGGLDQDVLVGDAGGGVRNYQFEYFETNLSALNSNSDGAFFNFTTDIGWSIGHTETMQNFSGTDQYSRTVFELMSTTFGGGIDPAWPDPTGTGGRYYWDSSYASFHQGGSITQEIVTAQGENYTLSMQVSDADYDTSLIVSWNGTVLATYDGIANTWSGTAPTVTDTSPSSNRQVLTWTVQGSQTGEASQLQIQAFDNDASGMRIDRITLDPVGAGGDDTLAGSYGVDTLYGQGGNDTLYGGNVGENAATSETGVADFFVYSLRSDNGNDVIKDFQVGVDKIYIVDALDTHDAGGTFDAVTSPETTRWPGSQSDTGTAANVHDSNYNLNYLDLTQGTSANQYLQLSDDGSGNLKISFFGADTGAALGSVVLEGVAYEGSQVNNNGAYGSVAEMLGTHDGPSGDGYVDPNINVAAGGFAGSTVTETSALIYITMDSFHQNLI
ncbi:MAG: Ig-like domain-containing protein [Burkholderiaceae bacterium]